ncbi:MAG: thymidine phosphorylase [Hyphomicrobiales bacterium]|nr:thymidine phosphorylase [Hyphomicrobiales bacterium]
MRLPQEIIRRKRDGHALEPSEIEAFIEGLTREHITEGQAAAFAMAVFFQGMSTDECAALTRAMMASGVVLDWSKAGLGGPVLDKHSTGGVGDNISLILAPAVAACGGFVPMISGRGLGHTGGTLDKLEAIPGYDATPDRARLMRVVREVGCAIIGQTAELAPADRRLYGIRDVTGTVESIPLITASILSKKLAAGLDGLVMDVKTGSGAFMQSVAEAQDLAHSLANVATRAGLPTVALVTDMDQPLASAAGNAVETAHAIAHLTGAKREPRVQEIVVALGAEMLRLGGLVADLDIGRRRIEAALDGGAAAEHFARMVVALGGPHDLLERPETCLAQAPVIRPVPSPAGGFVTRIATRAIGLAVVELGGGRRRAQDIVDHAVGFTDLCGIGGVVEAGDPLAFVHARDEAAAARAIASVQAALSIEDEPAHARAPVLARIVAG